MGFQIKGFENENSYFPNNLSSINSALIKKNEFITHRFR
jgi:hypothetical protein